ncbi:MAG: 50S ribosomal protein L25, partial [Polyangiaceae bacterium]|nr:50S ribosomal protein L25 [Polyangiaceae bacterium]
SLSLEPEFLVEVLESQLGVNTIVELDIDGKDKVQAMIAEYQYHPVSRELLHADFVAVDESTHVEVRVPLVLVGRAKGIVLGGKLRQVFRELPVRCLPSQIPAAIEHDITELGIEETVAAGELKLADGVEVTLGEKQTVAMVATDRRAKAEEEEEGAEAEAEA